MCLDLAQGRCYKLEISPENIAESHPKKAESVLFLLRRTGLKRYALGYLQRALVGHLDLREVSNLFFSLNSSYRIAAVERRNSTVLKSSCSPRLTLTQSPFTESELKLDSGITVILQSDIHSYVLTPLFAAKDFTYLSAVTLEYSRSLAAFDIHINLSLQSLLVETLVRCRNFTLLHQLVQYYVLPDCKETAEALLELGQTTYKPGFQLALDMLHRLKRLSEVHFSCEEVPSHS